MATTRERIYVLADRGDDPYLIAARLGLDVDQVIHTLRDATYSPPELGGGASELLYAAITGDSFSLESTGLLVPISYEAEAHVQNPVLSLSGVHVAAAAATVLEAELISPNLAEGWTVHAAFSILNLGNADLLTITGEKPLVNDGPTYFSAEDMSAGSTAEDLTVAEEEALKFFQVKSTAGGTFALQAVFKFALAG